MSLARWQAVGGDEESAPITSVAVSHHQQYLAVLRRDEPLELWDLATLRPLSTPAAYVSIAAMEWSAWAGHRKRDDPTPGGRGPSEEELILHMSDGTSVWATIATMAVCAPNEGRPCMRMHRHRRDRPLHGRARRRCRRAQVCHERARQRRRHGMVRDS